MYPKETEKEVAFDLAARAQLAQIVSPEDIPEQLFRHKPWHQRRVVTGFVAGLLVYLMLGGMLAWVQPPPLVLSAIEHEYDERTLRGSFMEPGELLKHFGLNEHKKVPGFPQLMRPCELAGTRAYHLTTFFEKGGMVTAYGFDTPVDLVVDRGWWPGAYWQVMTTPTGKTLVLVSQKKAALAAAQKQFLSHAG